MPEPTKLSQPVIEPVRTPAILSLSFNLTLTAQDLTVLAPDQITALFDAVGKIAAVKAVLDQR